MKEKVLPAMITTYEAFCACVEVEMKAIYIYSEVHSAYVDEIYQALQKRGYEIPGLPLRKGVLFVKGIDYGDCVYPGAYL